MILLFIVLLFISSCGKEDSIALKFSTKTLPEKLEYNIGEEINISELENEMIIDDGYPNAYKRIQKHPLI